MIETISIIVIAALYIIAAASVFIGMTLYDLRKIKLDLRLARNSSSRFRSRPLVSVVVQEQPTDDCVESLWNSDYQKIELLQPDRPAAGKLLLLLPKPDMILARDTISYAVHTLNSKPSLLAIELLPILRSPQTIVQLLHLYRYIATAPFVQSRAGLGVASPYGLWPMMLRNQQKTDRKTRVYRIFCWLVRTVNAITLIYISYLALALAEPTLLIAYLCALSIWVVLAIVQYPHLTLLRRATYIVLFPAALGYLALLALFAPFTPLTRHVNKIPVTILNKRLF